MEPHHQTALTKSLKAMDPAELKAAKAHAEAADSESHDSYDTVKQFLVALGIPITVGMVWKAIKVIKSH